MAKVIKYQFLSCGGNQGTEEVFLEKTLSWSEGNEAIARAEAADGVYTIEEDGLPGRPTTAEAVMDMLLGVTA